MTSTRAAGCHRHTPRSCRAIFASICASTFAGIVAMSVASVAQAKQYALIVGGIGGEEQYEQRFQSQASELATATKHAADQAEVKVLIGEQATKIAIRSVLSEWSSSVALDDQVIVTFIGHGTFDGDEYRFNIPGPDITASELRDSMQTLKARMQLVVLATSASGGAIPRLQSDKRVVITATKSGGERNATRFGEFWVQALKSAEADRDKNEWVTAQEAFDYASRQIADTFKSSKALATEHARLEGKRAESMPLGRLGNAQAMPTDAQLIDLFAERLRIENEFDALKERKKDLQADAYYSQLEKQLVALAKTQRRIDARQAALLKERAR